LHGFLDILVKGFKKVPYYMTTIQYIQNRIVQGQFFFLIGVIYLSSSQDCYLILRFLSSALNT